MSCFDTVVITLFGLQFCEKFMEMLMDLAVQTSFVNKCCKHPAIFWPSFIVTCKMGKLDLYQL